MKTLQRFNACRKSKNLQFFDFYEHPRKISFLPKTFYGINASTRKTNLLIFLMMFCSAYSLAQNTLPSSGNVGIGTTNPTTENVGIGTFAVNGAKLSVEGIIRARRVIVNADPWADYVFEPTYQLMTINQLEEYITTNKHLPNMPTANEVEAKGVDLGEINRVLVEKVEELTLYIIALNKRMEQLEADNKVLEGERE